MQGNIFKIIESMYENDQTCIRIGNKRTDFFQVDNGVKQGCILSPTLFNIFLSDLPAIFRDQNSKPASLGETTVGSFFWADDIAIISESKEGLQNSLDHLQRYCQSNKIRVNVKKTKCMVFNKSGKLLRGNNFHFGNEEIDLVNRFNYLGFLLTPSFNIKELLSDLYKRGLKGYFKLKTTLGNHFKTDIPLSLKLFDSLVKPILLYGSDFWGPLVYHLIDNNPIENLNIKLCKHLLGVNKHTSNAGCRAELGRQPLLLIGAKSFINNWIRIIDRETNVIFKSVFKVNRNFQLQWTSKLKDILQRHGLGYIWEHQFISEQTVDLKK